VGAVGFERHGNLGLLRSLVVDTGHRGAGIGKRLLVRAVRSMESAGVADAYALTTTIALWLAKEGWQELPQKQLPQALSASAELQGACPDTAQAFHRRLSLAQHPAQAARG